MTIFTYSGLIALITIWKEHHEHDVAVMCIEAG
jgi:hypothetical protein